MKHFLLLSFLLSSLNAKAQNWTNAFVPGQYDTNGNYIGGTEVMCLTPHKGKLFAATSYVCDLNNATYDLAGGTPILVLDSANGQWKQDVLFPDNLLIPSLREFVFTKDYLGNTITPDTVLMTGPNNKHHHIFIFVKNDSTGEWIKDSVTTTSDNIEIRSMGMHTDVITGHQYVFIGVSDFGVWKGEYNGSLPGKIQWYPDPEFVIPSNTRVPAIAEVNGEMYVGTTDQTSWVSRIFRRADGTVPSYQQVFADSAADGLDIRGFTPVKNSTGTEDLWFYCNDYFRRLLPQSNDSIVLELNLSSDLSQQTGKVFSGVIIAAYNDHSLFWKAPGTNDTLMYVGMQAMYDSTWLSQNPSPNIHGRTIDGMYYTRKQDGLNSSYQLHYIVNNTPIVIDTLLAVRTICVSPFASDSNKVLYSGGYHTNAVWLNNTAWVYRGDFSVATGMSAPPPQSKFSIPVYPNPAEYSFTIDLPERASEVFICDVTGKNIYERKNLFGRVDIDCRKFPGGVYLVHIISDEQSIYNQKIVVVNY